MACHNHRCWLLLPTKLHISSISAASTCRRITSTCGGTSVWSNFSFTCLTAGSFFEHVDDRGRADPQDTDDIPHAAAIERHVDDLLSHRGQTPFVLVLQEENGARTVTIVAAIALGAIGLFSVLHHIGTVTIRTLHLHKSHRRSPTRNCGICAHMISGHQLNRSE